MKKSDMDISAIESEMLRKQLYHARQAFSLVTPRAIKSLYDPSHVNYALAVYKAFYDSLFEISQFIRTKSMPVSVRDWSPNSTSSKEFRGYLLEETVSEGILTALEKDMNGTEPEGEINPPNNLLKVVVNDKSRVRYSRLFGMAADLVYDERLNESIRALKLIRKMYQSPD